MEFKFLRTNFTFTISISIFILLLYSCSSSKNYESEYDYGKNEYLSAKEYYNQNKIERAIEEIKRIEFYSLYYDRAQSLLKKCEGKLDKYYLDEAKTFIKVGNNKFALQHIDKLCDTGNKDYLTLYYRDSLIFLNIIETLQSYDYLSTVYLNRLNDSNRFFNLTQERMMELATDYYDKDDEKRLRFIVNNLSPDYFGYSEGLYLASKLDSTKDEEIFQSAIKYYYEGYISIAQSNFDKIKSTSLVYPKVLEFYQAVNNYYDSREPKRIAKYDYYHSLFSKYQNRLKLLRKMYDMGFRETDFQIGSTYDSQSALIYYYELYDGDYLVTVKMWLTYAINWNWELFVETR